MSYCTVVVGRNPSKNQPSNYKTFQVSNAFKKVGNAHCKITIDDGSFYIENIKASNGTYINGSLLSNGERRQVYFSDIINLAGETQLDLNQIKNQCQTIVHQQTNLPLATWGSRLGGYLLDGLFMSLITIPILGIFWGIKTLSEDFSELSIYILGFVFLLASMLLIVHFYYVVQIHKKGQTLGKKIARVKVLNEATKQYPSKLQLWGRFIAYNISGFILTIGFLMPLWTKKKQALHDLMAGTIVVKDVNQR